SGGAASNNSGGDPGYNPNGFVFTTKDGKDSPVTPSRGPRDAKTIDASIIEFFTDLFGPELTLGYEYDYKKKTQKTEAKEVFEYDSFRAHYFTVSERYVLMKTKRTVEMTPSQYYNTDWGKQKIRDSIMEVETIKKHNP